MTISLYDLLRRDVKIMAKGIGRNEQGNIYPLIMQEVEKYLISLILEETNQNYLHAARILGISRSTLYSKIKSLNIENGKS